MVSGWSADGQQMVNVGIKKEDATQNNCPFLH